MEKKSQTKEQLLLEIEVLRRKVGELEQDKTKTKPTANSARETEENHTNLAVFSQFLLDTSIEGYAGYN